MPMLEDAHPAVGDASALYLDGTELDGWTRERLAGLSGCRDIGNRARQTSRAAVHEGVAQRFIADRRLAASINDGENLYPGYLGTDDQESDWRSLEWDRHEIGSRPFAA